MESVHRIARARTPQCQRGLLAVVIDQHTMSAIERTFRYRIEQAEGRNHRACGKNLDLEIASGHVVDLLSLHHIQNVGQQDVRQSMSCAVERQEGSNQ